VAEGTEDDTRKGELMEGARRLREMHGGLKMFLDQEDGGSVYWVEKSGYEGTSFTLNAAPVNVADRLRPLLFGPDKTCITTSATLGTGDDQLSYFRERIGAQHVPAVKIGSPFSDDRAAVNQIVILLGSTAGQEILPLPLPKYELHRKSRNH
ncbi:hypothetical protein N9128_06485, partial [Akkermansiaceae bacterium]|nr:hypothetical protein [Akkermansiaceae bacterium]